MKFPLQPARVPGAKPATQQLWEMTNWGGRLLTTPKDYLSHRLFLKGRTIEDAKRFISWPLATPIHAAFNPEPEIFTDKVDYAHYFGNQGLPVPETIAVINDHSERTFTPTYTKLTGRTQIAEFIREQLRNGRPLAIKPAAGSRGRGVYIMSTMDGTAVVYSNGTRQELESVALELSVGYWIIQPQVQQADLLNRLNRSTLNTMRLITFRHSDGSVDIDFVILRIGRPGSQVDSNTQGGVSVVINAESGLFSPTAFQKVSYSLETPAYHPDSGMKFEGLVMPHWDETVDAARRMAQSAGSNRSIGWDVASTPSGPLFIEGNHDWDVQHAQLGTSGILTEEYLDRLRTEAGIEYDIDNVPPFRPLQAIRLYMKSLKG